MLDVFYSIQNLLDGKKTYAIAFITLLTAWGSFFTGEPILGINIETLGEAMNYTLAGLGLSTLRAGVKKAEPL